MSDFNMPMGAQTSGAKRQRFYGKYIGTVIDNIDPLKRATS